MSVSIPPAIAVTSPSTPAARPVRTWLVSPGFDLLFVANVLWWPLAVVLALGAAPAVMGPLTLFQIYFLSTPHRWITLILVFCDSERFWKNPVRYGGIGVSLIVSGLALVWVGSLAPQATNSLMLLMMVDYAWNAWHFAAQHAGIARIYSRTSRPDLEEASVRFERMALRLLILWAFLRQAVYVSQSREVFQQVLGNLPALGWLDPIVMTPAVIVLLKELRDFRSDGRGRLAYLASVICLYVGQLLAIRSQNQAWMQALFFGTAIFHSTEYLAIVNWSVQKRTTGIWQYQITRTGLAVLVFMAILGITNYAMASTWAYGWALLTLLVSLLHYGYDGMIWKARPAK